MRVIGNKPFELSKAHGIYEIRNTVNNKHYVGSAFNLLERRYSHQKDLRRRRHSNPRLQNSWSKYGESAFVFSVLEFVEDKTKLIEKEQFWVDSTLPFFNIMRVAGSNLGYRHSESTKKRIGDHFRGISLSEEHKTAISISNKGKFISDTHREMIRRSNSRRVWDEEARLRMSLSVTKALSSDEVKPKLVRSEEAKNKVRLANSIPIVQLTLSGDFVAEFPSISDAVAHGFNSEYVIPCCKGKIYKYKGYRFVYKKDYLPAISV